MAPCFDTDSQWQRLGHLTHGYVTGYTDGETSHTQQGCVPVIPSYHSVRTPLTHLASSCTSSQTLERGHTPSAGAY